MFAVLIQLSLILEMEIELEIILIYHINEKSNSSLPKNTLNLVIMVKLAKAAENKIPHGMMQAIAFS